MTQLKIPWSTNFKWLLISLEQSFSVPECHFSFVGPPLQDELLFLLMEAYSATTVPTMFLIHMYIHFRCIKTIHSMNHLFHKLDYALVRTYKNNMTGRP